MTDGSLAAGDGRTGRPAYSVVADPRRRGRARGRRRRPDRPRRGRGGASASSSTGPSSSSAASPSTPTAWRSAPEDVERVRSRRCRLLGAVGGPKLGRPERRRSGPEQALFALRGGLGLFANLRPVTVHPALVAVVAAPARAARRRRPADRPRADRRPLLRPPVRRAPDAPTAASPSTPCRTAEAEIRRIVRLAFELARGRRSKVTSVDKANVLASSRLWRKVAEEVRADYPDVQLEHRLVDSCAMQLVDAAAVVRRRSSPRTCSATSCRTRRPSWPARSGCCRRPRSGSAGRPTALLGLYEPIHGSAPDIAGTRPGQPDRHDPVRRRCSCAGRSAGPTRRRRSRRPSARRSTTATGRPTSSRPPNASVDGAATVEVGTAADDRRRSCEPARGGGTPGGRRHERQSSPRSTVRSSSTTRPSATGPRARGIILSLADKLRIARMLDEFGMPYIEGGWPGSNPKDIEFFAAARTMTLGDRPAGRLRLDPPPLEPARGGSRTCASWSPPRRRS